METNRQYYTIKEFAEIINVTPSAVRRLIDSKKIKAIDINSSFNIRRIFRIPVSELEAIKSKLQAN